MLFDALKANTTLPSLSTALFSGLIKFTTGAIKSKLLLMLGVHDFFMKSFLSVLLSVPSGYLAMHSSFNVLDVPLGALSAVFPSL